MKGSVVSTIPELLALFRARQEQLGISRATIDHIGGLTEGHSAKLLCDPPLRGLGEISLGAVLGALALRVGRVEIVEDPEQENLVRDRWRPRKRRLADERRRAPTAERWCIASVVQTDTADVSQEQPCPNSSKSTNPSP